MKSRRLIPTPDFAGVGKRYCDIPVATRGIPGSGLAKQEIKVGWFCRVAAAPYPAYERLES